MSGVVTGEKGAISGLFWQQRMPVQRGYLHPYTNLRSTPDLCPDLWGKKKERQKQTVYLLLARRMIRGGVGLWVGVGVNVQKSK